MPRSLDEFPKKVDQPCSVRHFLVVYERPEVSVKTGRFEVPIDHENAFAMAGEDPGDVLHVSRTPSHLLSLIARGYELESSLPAERRQPRSTPSRSTRKAEAANHLRSKFLPASPVGLECFAGATKRCPEEAARGWTRSQRC